MLVCSRTVAVLVLLCTTHELERHRLMPYIYFWNRCGRKGQPCKVTARGKMNSCRVEFADGFVMITSRNAIRRNSK
jgi:hypothetical protein